MSHRTQRMMTSWRQHANSAASRRWGLRFLSPSVALLLVVALWSSGRADLVAHYPLDEPAGTTGDESVIDRISGFNGTPTDPGGSIFGLDGANDATGTAMSVASTSIDVPYSPDLNPDSFTVTAWAKPTIADGAPYSVVTNREDLGPGVETGGFILYNINSRWEFWTGVGDTGAAGMFWDTMPGPDVYVDEWQHLAITYDADEGIKALYVDGELWMEEVGSYYSLNQSRDFHIGGGGDFGTQYRFPGTIDDVGFWDVALDESAISDIMLNGAASQPANQLALWKLDEPAGTGGPDSVRDALGVHHGSTAPPSHQFGVDGANAKTGTAWDTSNGSIDVLYEEALNPEESFTVTVWAKPETAGVGYQSVITSRDDLPAMGGYILYSTPGGTWQFWTGSGQPGWQALDGPPVEAGEWTHLAISYDLDTNEKVLWVNGEPFPDGGASLGYVPNLVENLHIGGGGDAGNEFRFNGTIDDVGIFNEVLDQDQIMNIMANGVRAFGGIVIVGDFNGNGMLDVGDIDILTAESASGENRPLYDLTGDGLVNESDVNTWAKSKEIGYTWIGDANFDGQFNTSDFVQVLGIGKYEQPGAAAVWSEGDWNGDGVFGTGDLVAALSDGGYELGPRTDVAAVPEPSSWTLILLAALACLGRRRRTRMN